MHLPLFDTVELFGPGRTVCLADRVWADNKNTVPRFHIFCDMCSGLLNSRPQKTFKMLVPTAAVSFELTLYSLTFFLTQKSQERFLLFGISHYNIYHLSSVTKTPTAGSSKSRILSYGWTWPPAGIVRTAAASGRTCLNAPLKHVLCHCCWPIRVGGKSSPKAACLHREL